MCRYLRHALEHELQGFYQHLLGLLRSNFGAARVEPWLGCQNLGFQFLHLDFAVYQYGSYFTSGNFRNRQVFPGEEYMLGCVNLLDREGHAYQGSKLKFK